MYASKQQPEGALLLPLCGMWSSARWIELPWATQLPGGRILINTGFILIKTVSLTPHDSLPWELQCRTQRRFWSLRPLQPCPGMDHLQPLPSLEASFWVWASMGHLSAEIEVCHLVATALLFFLPCFYKKGRWEFPHTRQACIFIASHPVNRKLLSLKRRSLVT